MTAIVHERDVEANLVKRCKELGWGCYKFTSPGRRSVPDRIVIAPPARYPTAQVFFVELKAPGKTPTAGQQREHARLRSLACHVWVLDSIEEVDTFIASVP